MSQLYVREANSSDVDSIMSCERQPGYENVVGRWTAEDHRLALADRCYRYLVAIDIDGGILGFLILRSPWPNAHEVTIKRIAVLRPGQGVGRKLIDEALALARTELGASTATLTVRPNNVRGIALYSAIGFEDRGKRSVVRDGQPATELVMTLDLGAHRA